jgi:SpoVK/Ycf46/Vps4 family AAA+-type ATPase
LADVAASIRCQLEAPGGVLLHGEPGTGKTLLVRALVEECSRMGGTPVAFFSRKGADCLGKYSGDAERLLRLLFKEAEAFAPSVIFFDELDGLVPVRGGGTGDGDQVKSHTPLRTLATARVR